MAKQERAWHPRFILYMNTIINHPNYLGLTIDKKADGSYSWIAPAKSITGQARIQWCQNKARDLGIPVQPGVYADVMLAIHPTKWKVCQTCGKEMSLYYHYPNHNFLNGLNRTFGTKFTHCDHIGNIWTTLVTNGILSSIIANYLIDKGGLDVSPFDNKHKIIDALEYACRKGNKTCLGPGAMSNFPDRYDGFHTYNRCCRASQDKGRSKENLKSYTKDRRAYEYWSDGNIHAANQFMSSDFFSGTSADHIGPISLGFVHDPRYLQPMPSGENSAKRDRLLLEDIEKIIMTERRTGVYPMSWYSKLIWEHIKRHYSTNMHKISDVYREALKQNMTNFMFILWTILDKCPINGEAFLVKVFLSPNFTNFDYSYQFNELGEIVHQTSRHHTVRNKDEAKRYHRIAIESVYDYIDKDNRHVNPDLIPSELSFLLDICNSINSGTNISIVKLKVEELIKVIQNRIITHL
jgi:Alw26I/Eco31I/Esp3I family type II restriction endonuclease